MADKTAPDVGAFVGAERIEMIESKVKWALSSELPNTTVTTTCFADKIPRRSWIGVTSLKSIGKFRMQWYQGASLDCKNEEQIQILILK